VSSDSPAAGTVRRKFQMEHVMYEEEKGKASQ